METLYLSQYDCFVRYFKRMGHQVDSDNPVVIFIPGLITPALPLFFDLIHDIKLRDFDCLLINYPGTGISDDISVKSGNLDDETIGTFSHHPREHASIIIDILLHEMTFIGNRSLCIMGHSMGGTVGAYLLDLLPSSYGIHSLIMSEANLFPGGGPGTKWISSFSYKDWITHGYDSMLQEWRSQGKAGDAIAASLPAMQQTSSPSAIYYAAKQLVDLDSKVQEIVFNSSIPRYFIYGERNLPNTIEEARPDTPFPLILHDHGIKTGVVKGAGHMMMLDNLGGYASILAGILMEQSII